MAILTLSKERDERDIHSKMGLEISGRGVGSLIELEVPREEDRWILGNIFRFIFPPRSKSCSSFLDSPTVSGANLSTTHENQQYKSSSTMAAVLGDLASQKIASEPYVWPADAALSPMTTALVIIDMQNDCE